MSLFKEWQERLENQGTNENQEFFENYLEKKNKPTKQFCHREPRA